MRKLVLLILISLPAVAAALALPKVYYRYYPTIIQLGDSYSAGFGALGPDAQALDDATAYCDNPTYENFEVTPVGRLEEEYNRLNRPVNAVFEACGGAEITDLHGQFADAAHAIPEDGERTLFVMTIGGNDIRLNKTDDEGNPLSWTAAIAECVLPGNDCSQGTDYEISDIAYDSISIDYLNTLPAYGDLYPKATFVIMGYPQLMQPFDGSCPGMTGITAAEAAFFDQQSANFNAFQIEQIDLINSLSAAKFIFIDVTEYFPYGACRTELSGKRYVHDVEWYDWPFTVHANSLHPTPLGWNNGYWQALLEEHILIRDIAAPLPPEPHTPDMEGG